MSYYNKAVFISEYHVSFIEMKEFRVNVRGACFLRVKDKYKLQQTFSVDPVYLRHENSQAATDFMVINFQFFTKETNH